MTYRVIITGSRKYEWKHRVWAYLDMLLAYQGDQLLIVNGGCFTGADKSASAWCDDHKVACHWYLANWDNGKSAGPIRNSKMVDDGAEQCVGFFYVPNLQTENRGTRDTMVKADKAGIVCLAAWGDQAPEPWHATKYHSEVKKNLAPYRKT